MATNADDFDDACLHFVQQSEAADREKFEIDVYMEEGCFLAPHDNPFDVLGAEEKYIEVYLKGSLAIPTTFVASGSAFSIGGRINSDYRSNLKLETVEALICAQDWLCSTFYTPHLKLTKNNTTVIIL